MSIYYPLILMATPSREMTDMEVFAYLLMGLGSEGSLKPFMPSGFFYLNYLDRFISSKRGICLVCFFYYYYCHVL